MRIALLTTNLQPDNGWATVAVKRGAALMALGIEVVALTGRNDGPPVGITPTDVRPVLPPIQRGNRSSLRIAASNPAVWRATADCDLVDAVSEPYALGCILASRGRPLVVTAHGSYIPLIAGRGLAHGLYRRLYRRAHILAVSDYTARRVADALDIATPEVILSGVDNEAYQQPRPRPEKRGPTVLCVAALKRRKGVHILLNAIVQVRRSIPDIQCVIIGDLNEGRVARLLKRRIGEYGLEDHVHLTGHLPFEDVVAWYQTADVFALPSLSARSFEGFGLVYLEANACGLPVIGTHDSGNESAIIDGETGFLVEQDSPEAVAARILDVLQNPALRERLSRGATAFARAHDWSHSAAEVLGFYQRVIALHGSQGRR